MTDHAFTDDIARNHERAIAEATSGAAFMTWIDGEAYTTGETFETRDPAVEKPITTVPRCGIDGIDFAVDAAREAFEGVWGNLSHTERADRLLAWAGRLTDSIDELALAHRAAADIKAGTVWINDYARFSPGLAFGGYKLLGIGWECGAETLDEYRQSKTVAIAIENVSLE